MYLCICERVAENGAFGSCFRHLSTTPQPASLARQAPGEPPPQNPFSTSTLTHSLHLPPFLRGTYFGSTSSVPKMDPSPSTLRVMTRGIYRTVLPTGLRPPLPVHHRPLSSGVYSLFGPTEASSYEHTTIAASPCPSSSTLDRTRSWRGCNARDLVWCDIPPPTGRPIGLMTKIVRQGLRCLSAWSTAVGALSSGYCDPTLDLTGLPLSSRQAINTPTPPSRSTNPWRHCGRQRDQSCMCAQSHLRNIVFPDDPNSFIAAGGSR
jgi:hypothetical protein